MVGERGVRRRDAGGRAQRRGSSARSRPSDGRGARVKAWFLWPAEKLTVDADNFDHGEGEEGQRGQVHLHKDGRQEEEHQDDRHAAGDPQLLRNPEWQSESRCPFWFPSSPKAQSIGHL